MTMKKLGKGEVEFLQIKGGTSQVVRGDPSLPYKGDVAGMRVTLSALPSTAPGLLNNPFRFMCPPTESMSRTHAFSHAEFDTLRAGQHSRPMGSQLTTISFSTLMLDWDATFAVWPNADTLNDAQRNLTWNLLPIIDQLEEILDSGTPVRLAYGQPSYWDDWDFNRPVTMRSFTCEEKAGEVDTRYFSFEFSEYRSLELQTRKYGKKTKTPTPKTKAKESRLPTTVEVFPDSSIIDRGPSGNDAVLRINGNLYGLAKAFYGSPTDWRLIVNANKILQRPQVTGTFALGGLTGGKTIKLQIPKKAS